MDNYNHEKFLSQLDLPYLETNQVYLHQIFETLEQEFGLRKNSQQVFVDLGAGNGQMVIFSSLNYGIKSVGIEIDPYRIKEAKNTIKSLKRGKTQKKRNLRKIKIIQGDFYTMSLKNCDFIYIYSLPTMQKYLKHVFKKAKNGAIILSHMYPIRGFNICLELMLRLECEDENNDGATYFYKKIMRVKMAPHHRNISLTSLNYFKLF